MKSALFQLLGAALATALTCHADPVTGWVRTNGNSTFTGGSEATSSPSVTGLPGDTIAANFPLVTIADKESLVLTGSVTLTGSAGGNQFRFGLFNGASPVVPDVGSGYIGVNADAPSSGSGALKFGDGTATNPFSGGASTGITSMSNPGGAAPGGIPIEFSLTVARDGANLDLEASINNTGAGGTWSSSASIQDWTPPVGFNYEFNTVAFLMGGSIGTPDANYSNVDVKLVEFDSDNDGMWDAWELANGLNVGIDDSGDDPENGGAGDGLTNIQEYLGKDGTPFTGDETDPQNPDSDGDGLEDGAEVLTHMTDPLDKDSDDDFFEDAYEIAQGTLPNDETSYPLPTGGYFIDFSSNGSNSQDGPRHDVDYLPFVADHEKDSSNVGAGQLIVDRAVSHPVPAFTGNPTVTLTVAYPDLVSADPRAKQMIGRTDLLQGGGFATMYEGEHRDLMRDWIGIDPRAAQGGNGMGVDTSMTFTLDGLPAGIYQYRGYHHDVANVQAPFDLSVTVGGGTAVPIGTFRMTHSNDNGLSPLTNPGTGNQPSVLPSAIEFLFTVPADNDPVVITYAAQERSAFQNSLVAVNAIEITTALDNDGDGIPNAADLRPDDDDTGLSSDADSLTDLEEFHLGTRPDDADTDGDGFNDDVETNTHVWTSTSDTGTSPWVADFDGDGLLDGLETNDFDFSNWPTAAGTDPFVVDTDLDGYGDGAEAYGGYDPTDGTNFPPVMIRLISVDTAGGTVTLEWDSLDNGTATYDIYASDTLTGDPLVDWTEVDILVPTGGTTTSYTETQVGSGSGSETLPNPMPAKRFYVIYEFP